ncbi:MAG: hypothetical protein ACAH65_03140, partial [Chloroflexota bacterium]
VVLGPVGANFGSGMTGGRAYLIDPAGRHVAALDGRSVGAVRLATAVAERPDGRVRLAELVALLEAQRAAGSALAARLLEGDLAAVTWLVEPLPVAEPVVAPQPDRNPTVPVPMPTPVEGGATVGSAWGGVTPG